MRWRNLDLERVFRHAESASHLRVVRDGQSRLAQTAADFSKMCSSRSSTGRPPAYRGFIVTLFDHILYEAWVYEPESIDRVLAESLRFVLMGVGVGPDRVASLVTASAHWRASS